MMNYTIINELCNNLHHRIWTIIEFQYLQAVWLSLMLWLASKKRSVFVVWREKKMHMLPLKKKLNNPTVTDQNRTCENKTNKYFCFFYFTTKPHIQWLHFGCGVEHTLMCVLFFLIILVWSQRFFMTNHQEVSIGS